MTDRSPPTEADLLTPPGTGGIAVIRIRGPRAVDIVTAHFRSSKNVPLQHVAPSRIVLGRFSDHNEEIDDVLVTVAQSPDQGAVIDLCSHGSLRVVERILLALQAGGASVVRAKESPTPNWPVENHIQAEAMRNLWHAPTRRAARFLANQRISLPDYLHRVRRESQRDPDAAADKLTELRKRYELGRFLVHGVTVTIAGPPNAGKSTLANQLFSEATSLVSPLPGTTRDWVSEPVAIEGVPVHLLDTAGVRATDDAIEREAVTRALDRIVQADLVIVVVDGSLPPDRAAWNMMCDATESARTITAINKSDLGSAWPADALPESLSRNTLAISAATGQRINDLRRLILHALGLSHWDESAPCPFTSRQTDFLDALISGLRASNKANEALWEELI